MTKAMEEARAIALKPANLMRAIEYALRHSPVVETTFSEEGDFDVEIHEPASLEAFATALINEVAPDIIATALYAASAPTAGEREPVDGLYGTYTPISISNTTSPPASELEALREEIEAAVLAERESCAFAVECHSGLGDPATIEACAQIVRDRSDPSLRTDSIHLTPERYAELEASESRIAEALKALDDARAAILEADRSVLTCTLWMSERISPNEAVADYLDAAARRVREGGQEDG